MRFTLGLLLATLTVTPALAAEWVTDPAQSELTFTATDGGKPFTGKFASFDAKIEYDATALDAASVDITIPLAGLDAGSAERNDELQEDDWFNPKAFPTAHYVAKGFTHAESDPPSLIANGTLTIRDISQPVKLQFRLEPSGENLIATGTATLDRSAFKLGLEEYPAGGSIGTDVLVRFKLVANKKP